MNFFPTVAVFASPLASPGPKLDDTLCLHFRSFGSLPLRKGGMAVQQRMMASTIVFNLNSSCERSILSFPPLRHLSMNKVLPNLLPFKALGLHFPCPLPAIHCEYAPFLTGSLQKTKSILQEDMFPAVCVAQAVCRLAISVWLVEPLCAGRGTRRR